MTKKILIVDDEPNIVLSLEFMMKKEGFAVAVAGDGDAALEQVAAFAPDLVLLDVMMPKKSGYEVCQILRADPAQAALKIVMLTAKGRETEVAKGIALGADAYVTKPFLHQGSGGAGQDPARMNAKIRFGLAVAVLGLLMTGPFLLTAGIVYADLDADGRAAFLAGDGSLAARRHSHDRGRTVPRPAAPARPVQAVCARPDGHGRDAAVDVECEPQFPRDAGRAARGAGTGPCRQRSCPAARRAAQRCRDPDRGGQRLGGGRKEPAGRAHVGTGAGRGGVQPRRAHPALQQSRPPAVQGAGARADVDERRGADRPRSLDLFHAGARANHPCAG